MIIRLDHVAIVVKDVERALKFYTKIMGFKVVQKRDIHGRVVVALKAGDAEIDLWWYREEAATFPEAKKTDIGVKHVCILVDDVQRMYEDMKEKGVSFRNPPTMGGPLNRMLAYFNDPDGIEWQLIER
jgi:catechol 2,3-dioxygenase-like lactoylglutathione lyase family enzyme